ncbi:hypothetical protein Cflav_PD5278 [Pedosphaera parvula Ellin514]|uniref:Uncharacterized protein n=1 Tax=Pedosphaera parvula (strain Ellin514) TaxID=320771 RepID=B9XCH5_PEDPL|nr:hypothetical protein Cflav_PD5278 [Pedosphaera parvula Ellin514]
MGVDLKQVGSPLLRFGNFFNDFVSLLKKATHVSFQHEVVDHEAQDSERAFEIEDILHGGYGAIGFEVVIVVEMSEGAADEGIAKVMWTVVLRDATCQFLPDAKMSSAPGHFFSQRNQT